MSSPGGEERGAPSITPESANVLSQSDCESIVAHMNEDHADALLLYARAFTNAQTPGDARMLAIDGSGFDLEVTGPGGVHRHRLAFPDPVETPGQARKALIAMVGEARAKLGD